MLTARSARKLMKTVPNNHVGTIEYLIRQNACLERTRLDYFVEHRPTAEKLMKLLRSRGYTAYYHPFKNILTVDWQDRNGNPNRQAANATGQQAVSGRTRQHRNVPNVPGSGPIVFDGCHCPGTI